MIPLRFRGAFASLSEADRNSLFDRSTSSDPAVRQAVASIVADVRSRGDAALRDLAARFDPVVPDELEVPRAARRRALDGLAPELRRAMERAADNIASVHRASLPQPIVTNPEPGIAIVRRPDPLARVGCVSTRPPELPERRSQPCR